MSVRDKSLDTILDLIVTMPTDREHTFVPCKDLRLLASTFVRLRAETAALRQDRDRQPVFTVKALRKLLASEPDSVLVEPRLANAILAEMDRLYELIAARAAPPPEDAT